jgi:GntR family transcriptional regulator
LELADRVRAAISAGTYGATGGLPSEAELGREHGVSRVTVRRALEQLRDEGLVTSRQGAGWFVARDPVRQTLGRFRTVEAALEAAGTPATRKVLGFSFEPATTEVAAALGLQAGDEVLRVRRVTLAAGEPFGLVTVWIPADLGRDLSRADVEQATFYDLLPLQGVEPVRAVQTVSADAADASDARALAVKAGSPLLTVRRVTYTRDGRPVLLADHRYPGHRTSFEVEFGVTPEPVSTRSGSTYPSSRHLRSVGERHG